MNHVSGVANSLQNFSASPEEKFCRCGKKFGPPVMFTFERIWVLRKILFFSERVGKFIELELERIRGGKQLF
jgi:hypothetical protein